MNLFDIPGFGQKFSHKELSKVIQDIDIVFWFIDASKGVKKDDKLFLENIKGLDTKVIIVLNKIDAISENNEIEDLLKEINNEISKIKIFFKEEGVLNNLVTVFPFSATKSLVGTIKGEDGAFKVIDKILQNVLLYTVFIESYRGYMGYYLDDEVSLPDYKNDMLEIVSDIAFDLEYKLKDEISFGSSLNPFSSKGEEAEPIVEKYLIRLEERLNTYNEAFVNQVKDEVQTMIDDLSSFEAFGKVENIHFKLETLTSIDISIDLDSIAMNSFFGDSFSEEVATKFEKKITKKVKRQIPKILDKYENSLTLVLENLREDSIGFARKLDLKLAITTE
jgi:translation elongation factor EF-G